MLPYTRHSRKESPALALVLCETKDQRDVQRVGWPIRPVIVLGITALKK